MILIAVCYGVTLLFFDQFVFFAPYFTVYIPFSNLATLTLDLILSALTGIVTVISIKQARSVLVKPRGAVRMGFLGILAVVFAGACPCYYMALLLAGAGGFGGALAVVGIFMNAYQFPIKLASAAILLGASYGLERSFRMTCKLQ
jgi:hypothetical protein